MMLVLEKCEVGMDCACRVSVRRGYIRDDVSFALVDLRCIDKDFAVTKISMCVNRARIR